MLPKREVFVPFVLSLLLLLGNAPAPTMAGPAASGICYAGCAAVVVACFSAAGFTFGTVPGAQIATVPALAACNAAFGTCETACMVAFFLPTA